MNNIELLERIAVAARRVRTLQRAYFAAPSTPKLYAAKDAERDLDRLIAEYDGQPPPAAPIQGTLFGGGQ